MKTTLVYLLIGIAVIALLIVLNRLNKKDEKQFIDKLNRDYKRLDQHKDDNDPDDLKSN